MIFFDTHIHLKDMPDTTPEVLKASGVMRCICVSTEEKEWDAVAKQTMLAPEIITPAFAVHPWHAQESEKMWHLRLEKLLIKFPQSLIGECGFDRIRNVDFAKQREVFDIQIELAKRYERPLLIHAVKAWSWLDDYWKRLPEKFVFHSFNGRVEHLRKIMSYGGYIAVNKSILKNKVCSEIISDVAQNRLLLESDAPFQSKLEDLPLLCTEIARIRKTKTEDMMKILYENAVELVK